MFPLAWPFTTLAARFALASLAAQEGEGAGGNDASLIAAVN
jgi:hypothetical protein